MRAVLLQRFVRSEKRSRPSSKDRFRPLFETLEDRTVPSTLTVGSSPGDNFATISAAVSAATVGDTILVDPGVLPQSNLEEAAVRVSIA
ncbi:MAG TPA: hypothetical protein VG099_00265 [Gemmataceae bacterium]|nr:hypothetical protein [Gemmataceae bacterium]